MVKPTPHSTNRFLVLEMSIVGSTKDILTPQSLFTELKTEEAMPHKFSHQPPNLTPVLVHSTTLCGEVLALIIGYSWGLGFIRVQTLASACVLHLPTNSV